MNNFLDALHKRTAFVRPIQMAVAFCLLLKIYFNLIFFFLKNLISLLSLCLDVGRVVQLEFVYIQLLIVEEDDFEAQLLCVVVTFQLGPIQYAKGVQSPIHYGWK